MAIELDDLTAPADADNFRMTVDWGRWYVDPLPGCDIAPATEDKWPSCSKVKKASEKDWSFLVLPRVAAIDGAELARIGGLDRTQRLDALKSHENHAKQIAFGRGTIYHLWCEDLLAGRAPRDITEQWLSINKYPAQALVEAKAYLPALRDFFQTYQPEPVLSEYVAIHRTLNGHGYGATVDALVKIEGELVGVDWKTRSDGSQHAAYPEELAQVACGARAEYMVVNGGGEARRQRLPEIKGGYVVSIKTDGARLYPLDIDKGWQHWCRLHEWWVARLTEKDGIKRVLPKKSAPKIAPEAQPAPAEPAPPVLDAGQAARLNAVKATPHAERPPVEIAADKIARPDTPVGKALDEMDAAASKLEGGPADPADVNTIRARIELGLTQPQTDWVNYLRTVISPGLTERRANIYCAITKLVTSDLWDDKTANFNGIVQAIVDSVSKSKKPRKLSAAIAGLTLKQSAALRVAVDSVIEDASLLELDPSSGVLRMRAAA